MKVNPYGSTQPSQIDPKKESRSTEKTEKAASPENSARASGVAKKTPPARPEGSARAEISAKARELAQAKAIATQTPEIRENRVAELKEKIANGTYKIDEKAIADRLVDEHLAMS